MKKYILLLTAVLFLAFSSVAQTTRAKTLDGSKSYYVDASNYSLSITGDSVLTYTITLNKVNDVLYDVQLKLDSVSGTPDYDIDLKGRLFSDDTWTDLETDVTWDGTSSDTTILFQEHTTAVFYRQFQIQVNGQTGTGAATLDKLEFKIWE